MFLLDSCVFLNVFYFLKIVIVLSQFYTQTTKCVIMPTLKVDSFATTVYLFYLLFTVTKAPGSFLAISADDQRWTFKLACLQCKTYPFIYNEKKFSAARIHLPNRYCGITCFTLLNKIHMGESVRILGDRCLKKWHVCIKNCRTLFQPSFLQTCSLFCTKQSQSFAKALWFKWALKIPTDSINAALSINALLFFYTLQCSRPPIVFPNV